MPEILEKPLEKSGTQSKKVFFQIFLKFEKPAGYVSIFLGDGTSGCGVYVALAKIFQRQPREIFEAINNLAFNNVPAFMQEYLSLGDASTALTSAFLFSRTAGCTCFINQEAKFYIIEREG